MYCKRFLTALTAAFVLFVLTGCGYGTISSVDEEAYFPHFEAKADNVSHYAGGIKNDAEVFKSKGDYDVDGYNHIITRYDPLGDGTIEKAKMKPRNFVQLNILGDDIARDDELFNEIFGLEDEEFQEIKVTKRFSGDDKGYFNTYSRLLEEQGFEEKSKNLWSKYDDATQIELSWNYFVDSYSSSLVAIWYIQIIDESWLEKILVKISIFGLFAIQEIWNSGILNFLPFQ
jgi:hypothetical protein